MSSTFDEEEEDDGDFEIRAIIMSSLIIPGLKVPTIHCEVRWKDNQIYVFKAKCRPDNAVAVDFSTAAGTGTMLIKQAFDVFGHMNVIATTIPKEQWQYNVVLPYAKMILDVWRLRLEASGVYDFLELNLHEPDKETGLQII